MFMYILADIFLPWSNFLEAVVKVLQSLKQEAPPIEANPTTLQNAGVKDENGPEHGTPIEGRHEGWVVMETQSLAEPMDGTVSGHFSS